ncbi:HPr kinase/phosphorylase [Jannaschia aquimarina]|uniref:HprK protein n=1 Tax=Jannaschia aquimarina TaxID=935700 RepID=A0A0D1DDC2_9RHOB|nr:hypothetical protein [Jannaschia aquimarina]KIT17998.1 HPr kinase/phosphorylase [Jannaschia aquimarina]SNS88228.1 Hpr(Ser) kinase/phosphatase [Jannaschia aquimarina]
MGLTPQENEPRPRRIDDVSASLHATTVVIGDKALAICGPSGSGKSGVAAQIIAMDAGLVCDDLTIIRRDGDRLIAAAPPEAIQGIELRGFGIVAVPLSGPMSLAGLLWLGPSSARYPVPETIDILGCPVPILRHPSTFDVAAKAFLWMRGGAG